MAAQPQWQKARMRSGSELWVRTAAPSTHTGPWWDGSGAYEGESTRTTYETHLTDDVGQHAEVDASEVELLSDFCDGVKPEHVDLWLLRQNANRQPAAQAAQGE